MSKLFKNSRVIWWRNLYCNVALGTAGLIGGTNAVNGWRTYSHKRDHTNFKKMMKVKSSKSRTADNIRPTTLFAWMTNHCVYLDLHSTIDFLECGVFACISLVKGAAYGGAWPWVLADIMYRYDGTDSLSESIFPDLFQDRRSGTLFQNYFSLGTSKVGCHACQHLRRKKKQKFDERERLLSKTRRRKQKIRSVKRDFEDCQFKNTRMEQEIKLLKKDLPSGAVGRTWTQTLRGIFIHQTAK